MAAAAAAVNEDEGGIDLLANKSAGGGSNEDETSKDEDHSSSSLRIPADAGVLSSLSSSSSSFSSGARVLQSTASPTPVPPATVCGASGSVDCDNGNVVGDPTTTCESACAGSCCVGTDACKEFTGNVCKDGSCAGIVACQYSTIPWVVNSCKGKRGYACFLLGNVGNIVNSCQGYRACNAMGRDQNNIYCPSGPGTVGEIRDSCIGDDACSWMSYDGGTVGNVINSCRAKKACQSVADQSFIPHLPNQGDIVNLCNGYKCCYEADVLPAVCPTAKSGKKNKKAKPTQAPTVSAAPVKAKAAKKKTNTMIASLFN